MLRYGNFTICNMAAVGHFRNLEFVSCDLYHHAILLHCAKFH